MKMNINNNDIDDIFDDMSDEIINLPKDFPSFDDFVKSKLNKLSNKNLNNNLNNNDNLKNKTQINNSEK